MVRKLLKLGVDPNAQSFIDRPSGSNATASQRYSPVETELEIVDMLLAAGASYKPSNDPRFNTLVRAVHSENIAFVRIILKRGISPNPPDPYRDELSFETQLISAVKRCNIEMLDLLLSHDANTLQQYSEYRSSSRTALIQAVQLYHSSPSQDSHIMDRLLTSGPAGTGLKQLDIPFKTRGMCVVRLEPCDKEPEIGDTSLDIAARGGLLHVCEQLIGHGAAFTKQILPRAACGGLLSFVSRLVHSKTQIPCYQSQALEALRIASFLGNTAIMTILLSDGANPNARGNPPLALACLGGHLEAVQLLLTYRARPNVRLTELPRLSYNLHTWSIESFPIAQGAMTALELACTHGLPELVGALLDAKSDINALSEWYDNWANCRFASHFTSYRGCSPLVVNIWQGSRVIFDLLIRAGAKLQLSLEWLLHRCE